MVENFAQNYPFFRNLKSNAPQGDGKTT